MAGWDLQIVVDGAERFAADAPDPRNVPEGLTFSTSWQGGDKSLSWSVSRLPSDPPVGVPFSRAELLADGGSTLLAEVELRRQGRNASAGLHRLRPEGLGYAARFEDRGDFYLLGIDREYGRWRGATLVRQQALLTAEYKPRAASAEAGGIKLDVGGTWQTNPGRPISIAFYSAAPLRVGRVLWPAGKGTNLDPSAWIGRVSSREWDGTGGATILADWATGAMSGTTPPQGTEPPQDVTVNAPAVEISLHTEASSESDGDSERHATIEPIVVGDHGLPLVGTGPADYGLRSTDIWAYLARWVGLKPGRMVVENPDLVLRHFVEMSPTTAGAAWNNVNGYHGNAWEVRRGRVNSHPFGDAPDVKTWLVRSDDPAFTIEDEGLDASESWAGVLVTYTTPAGEQRSVGPSWATATSHSDLLEASRSAAALAGLQRIKPLNLDVPTDEPTAIMAGVLWLQDAAARQRKGKLRITGHVWDENGVPWPCFHVRGGHFARVVDSDDPTPRRILETSYDHDSSTLQADLDDTDQRYSAFIAHLINRTTGKT